MNAPSLMVIAVFGMHFLSCIQSGGTSIWKDVPETAFARKGAKKEQIRHYRTVTLDTASLRHLLAQASRENADMRNTQSVITLPLPDGTFTRFRFISSPTATPGGAAGVHEYQTFMGSGVDDPYMSVAFDLTPAGFHAMITSGSEVIYIEPYQPNDTTHYLIFYKREIIKNRKLPFEESGPIDN